ncbi:DUF2271 domain-containing protein [Fulvivirga ulvae]|uniref:DUF2271 domain-containing protein n=1 Tax=Fulvivirga ulvae TaxID=2904245 RepID=UPI001F48430B|nr:DUF2271 domain-containing protein [Fulvivirga ulvae]UII33579.1 DUF2271 domain-containing protein [Fulvivirga ulvae]
MSKVSKICLLALMSAVLISWSSREMDNVTAYKCLVQLTNYQGEGAYMIISLIDPDGNYEKTLYVMGQDEEWYPDLTQWWKFFDKSDEDVDGISGATIAGGERTVCIIQLDDTKLNAGYKLRFETAVEDQKYFLNDVEVPLTTENVKGKFDGQGYIRYIRMMPN